MSVQSETRAPSVAAVRLTSGGKFKVKSKLAIPFPLSIVTSTDVVPQLVIVASSGSRMMIAPGVSVGVLVGVSVGV